MSDELAADAVVDEKQQIDTADKVADKSADTGAADADKDTGDKSAVVDKSAAGDADKGADKAGDDKSADADKDKPGDIPENWRDLAADGDEDTLKLLKRYGSLKGVAKALKEKEALIRSGKMKQAMPDPTDEKAMAEWRKAEGIPDDPSGYKLPETVTKRMTDDDKPLIASFTDFAHKKGARPDVVEIGTEWYINALETIEAERAADDKTDREEAEEALRSTWGNAEYKGNKNLAERFVEAIPGVDGVAFGELRLPSGKLLGSVPEFMEWASDQGRAMFGDVAFASSDSAAQHASRKAEIEKVMKSDINAYWRDPAMQKEYQEILQREEKRRA